MGLILLIVLIVLLLGAWPGNGMAYSQNWGNGPGGLVGLLLIVLLVLLLMGHVPIGF